MKTDGHYGPLTKAAVVLWQAAHFLKADGVVGPVTAKAMGL
nr:peptidoglycan-binding domain-containing protein [Azospirillum oryzae]